MSSRWYTEELKVEAIKQIIERGHAAVSGRLGVSIHSLYAWQKQPEKPRTMRQADSEQAAELQRVKSESRRVTEERDISNKAAVVHRLRTGQALPSNPGEVRVHA